MDFHQLLAKMQELDAPVAKAPVADTPVGECGDMPPAPMGASMGKPDTPPPSMSINLNAQGLDNIEELMALIKAVNPDAEKPMGSMAPTIEIEPMDKPAGGLPPLGMLPDMDSDNDNKIGGEAPPEMDIDGDEGGEEGPEGDEEDEEEEESFANSLDDSEPETMGVDAAIPNGNDINKPKTMTKHSYRQGDNPMAMEGEELRAWIKSELTQRLAEAKGAK